MTDFPTQEEIVARIKEREPHDVLGFEWHEYANALDREHFRIFAKKDADLSKIEPQWQSVDEVRETLIDYLPFAWEKANNNRGISANRSVMHIIAWLWLMGGQHREFGSAVEAMFDGHYEYYGKPILRAVSQRFNFDWCKHDDDNWTNHEGEIGPSADRAFESWDGLHLVPS